jgi:hypothetical protein
LHCFLKNRNKTDRNNIPHYILFCKFPGKNKSSGINKIKFIKEPGIFAPLPALLTLYSFIANMDDGRISGFLSGSFCGLWASV